MSKSPKSNSESDDLTPINISNLRTCYDEADQYVREIAEYRDAASVPALNQLRYAGHHFLEAIGDDGSIQSEEAFRRAYNHCERALYDATDAGITFARSKSTDSKKTSRTLSLQK